MSRDVARIIVDMINADKTLDGLKLKEMFMKKVDMDGDEIKQKLRDLVAAKIKSERQPLRCEIILTDATIFGGNCTIKYYQTEQPKSPFIQQMPNDPRVWVEITNPETRFLIKYAVLPLQLQWKLNQQQNGYGSICVTWKHWADEIK